MKDAIETVKSQQDMILGLPLILNKLEQQIDSHLALIQEYRKENIVYRDDLKNKSFNQKLKDLISKIFKKDKK